MWYNICCVGAVCGIISACWGVGDVYSILIIISVFLGRRAVYYKPCWFGVGCGIIIIMIVCVLGAVCGMSLIMCVVLGCWGCVRVHCADVSLQHPEVNTRRPGRSELALEAGWSNILSFLMNL